MPHLDGVAGRAHSLDAMTAPPITAQHPLDPLSAHELIEVVKVARKGAREAVVVSAFLDEPTKAELRAFTFAQEGALPRRLAAVHPRHGSPYVGIVTLGVVALAGALAAAAIGFVVYKNLVPPTLSPYNVLPYIYLSLLLAGLAFYGSLRVRDPERARAIGTAQEHAG